MKVISIAVKFLKGSASCSENWHPDMKMVRDSRVDKMVLFMWFIPAKWRAKALSL